MKRANDDRDALRSAAAEELLDALHQPVPRAIKPLPARRKEGKSDFIIATLGLTLGLVCALFPWYIFFNQEKFGIRALTFEGSPSSETANNLAYRPYPIGAPITAGQVPRLDLDFLPTGTLPDNPDARRALSVQDQPFPGDIVAYKLVHVANGRAMIQDEDGLWVVQPGSRLPDASHVSLIEKRDDGWVLVTSRDKVLRIGN